MATIEAKGFLWEIQPGGESFRAIAADGKKIGTSRRFIRLDGKRIPVFVSIDCDPGNLYPTLHTAATVFFRKEINRYLLAIERVSHELTVYPNRSDARYLTQLSSCLEAFIIKYNIKGL